MRIVCWNCRGFPHDWVRLPGFIEALKADLLILLEPAAWMRASTERRLERQKTSEEGRGRIDSQWRLRAVMEGAPEGYVAFAYRQGTDVKVRAVVPPRSTSQLVFLRVTIGVETRTVATCHAPYQGGSSGVASSYAFRVREVLLAQAKEGNLADVLIGDMNTYRRALSALPEEAESTGGSSASTSSTTSTTVSAVPAPIGTRHRTSIDKRKGGEVLGGLDWVEQMSLGPTSGFGANSSGSHDRLDQIHILPTLDYAAIGRYLPLNLECGAGPRLLDLHMAAWAKDTDVPSDHLPIYIDTLAGPAEDSGSASSSSTAPPKRVRLSVTGKDG